MGKDKNTSSPAAAPELLQTSVEDIGGRKPVNGWRPEEWSSLVEFLRGAFDRGSIDDYPFDSAEEAVNFMSGTGEYRDRNSFFYSNEDYRELYQEGSLQPLYCPECFEDFKSQLEQDGIPEKDIVNPIITPRVREYQGNSFKPEEVKVITELAYICQDHTQYSMIQEKTRYE